MKRKSLNRVLLALAFLLLFDAAAWCAINSQSNLVIAIYTSGFGMVTPAGLRPYALVSADGWLTYSEVNGSTVDTLRKHLSANEMKSLHDVLETPSVQNLKGDLPAAPRTKLNDYGMSVVVTIPRSWNPQVFTLEDYDCAKHSHDAASVDALMHLIDQLRRAHFNLSCRSKGAL